MCNPNAKERSDKKLSTITFINETQSDKGEKSTVVTSKLDEGVHTKLMLLGGRR